MAWIKQHRKNVLNVDKELELCFSGLSQENKYKCIVVNTYSMVLYAGRCPLEIKYQVGQMREPKVVNFLVSGTGTDKTGRFDHKPLPPILNQPRTPWTLNFIPPPNVTVFDPCPWVSLTRMGLALVGLSHPFRRRASRGQILVGSVPSSSTTARPRISTRITKFKSP